ncbi:hypothetical protein [Rhodoblastus sp.]|uniref:hypothetical protein n=1 Tax=Rhodoblastus sp. TaxID=1962975 RepID=UPI003F9E411B
MSVPGLNGVGPDIANAIRLAQSAAPQPGGPSVSSAPATSPEDTAAQAALNEYLNGAAPSDVSIGLYSAAPDSAAAMVAEQAALAEEVQTGGIQRQELVQQDLGANALANATLAADLLQQQAETAIVQQNQGALAEIENSLNAALVEARQTSFVAGLQNLIQAVEAGASEESVALADRLQAAQQGAGGLDLAAIAASLPENETAAALPALVENLIATTQSGDMTAAGFFAQAIRMQIEETPEALPPRWLATLAAAPGASLAPFPPDVADDPLAQAYQVSLIIDIKTTLNKLRKLREDRSKILPILALEQSGLRQGE